LVSYRQFHSLFCSNSSITIKLANKPIFQYFGDYLDNRSLSLKATKVTKAKSQEFYLSSNHLRTIPQDQLNQFDDCTFFVNSHNIFLNFSLISCICEKCIHLNRYDKLSFDVPNEFLQVFILDNHEISSIVFLIHFFGVSFPFSLISDKIPIPETLSQSIQYISMKGCQSLENHFYQSMKIIFEHFNEISVQDFSSIPIESLEILFSSNQLILDDEDQLFNLILGIIQLDENKKVLFKYVNLEYVSSQFIISFFQDFQFEHLDIDLFKCFQRRLCCDVTSSSSDISFNRWKNHSKFLTRKDIDEIYSIFSTQKHPIENILFLNQDNSNLQQ
jgi:hypothetical protein